MHGNIGNGKKLSINYYPTYQFRKNEQDPVVDKLRTMMDDTGIKMTRLSEKSGVSYSTLYNWFEKCKTRRPQYACVAAVVGALGFEFAIVQRSKANGKVAHARQPQVVFDAETMTRTMFRENFKVEQATA